MMFCLTKSIRYLMHSNCISSRSFVLWNRNFFTSHKKIEILTKASLLTRPYLVIDSLNFEKLNFDFYLESKRCFSKKKGPPKRTVEIEEESDSDEEQYEQSTGDDDSALGDIIIQKNVTSLRLDSIIKAGLSLPKKKIEQDFYAFKLRVNGSPVVKKALNMYVGDEVDVIRGFSPDTSKYLIVDRVIIKGIDKATASGLFPVKLEVLKQLTIENYEEPWNPSSVGQL